MYLVDVIIAPSISPLLIKEPCDRRFCVTFVPVPFFQHDALGTGTVCGRMSTTTGESKISSGTTINSEVVRSFEPVKTFDYHQRASITSLDFNDTGQFLISAGIDKDIQVYNIYKGVHHSEVQSQKYGVHLARFTHKELNCLYASTPGEEMQVDDAIRFLSLSNKQYLRYFKGHKNQVTSIEMNPVLETFMSSSRDRSVKLWDLRTSSPVGSLDVGQPSVIAHDPKGIVFAVGLYPDPYSSGSGEGIVKFYNAAAFDKLPFLTVKILVPRGQVWTKLEFSNNGKLLLVGTNSHEHYVLDAFLGQLLTTLRMPSPGGDKSNRNHWMEFKYPSTGSCSFTPCGKYVLLGSPQLCVFAFDLNSIKNSEGGSRIISQGTNVPVLDPLQELRTNQGIPKIVAFNPRLLTFATADNTVSLWQPDLSGNSLH